MARHPSALILLLAMAPAACRTAQEPAATADEAVVTLTPAPPLTSRPDPSWRWLDALDQPYSEPFRKSFRYGKAEVTVRHPKQAEAFACRVVARKLKPNFAYQVKLVGMPPTAWGEKGDAESNRRIGELGRWWRRGEDAGNAYVFDDDDKAKMEAYLLFGYFVTGAEGKADVRLRLDSSFHVLWKTSQWPPAKEDGRPTRHKIVARAGAWGYDRAFPDGELELYAEAQYGRPPRGTVWLPAGRYTCFVLLTEESFHAWGGGDGGDWAPALAAPIEFIIGPPKAKEPR